MNSKKNIWIFIIIFFLLCFSGSIFGSSGLTDGFQTNGKDADTSINHPRLTGLLITTGALYAGSLTGLYQIWYKDYPSSTFHFFNDNNEWQYMDKMGHATASYWLGKIGYSSLRWCGVERKKAIWYGGSLGLIFQTTVEVFDGFSQEWGFSPGDMIANTAGTGLFIGQQLGWHEQRIFLKWSFHETKFAKYRPELLGKNFIQHMLKDYNGQTYWLSGNLSSFLPRESRFPKWINIAIGYGAEGMTGAAYNPTEVNGSTIPSFKRYQQIYLSFDLDLTRIKTHSETLNFIFQIISFIKFPFPALEYNTNGKWIFHPIYF